MSSRERRSCHAIRRVCRVDLDWVVIDEAQRVPDLLNEIHSLYEQRGLNFAITGSSARKLKRSDANLLAGRAIRCDFFPLVWQEIQDETLLLRCIDFGTLPYVVTHPEFGADTLYSYIETYLKEEVAAEALTRNLEPFARFLRTAAQHHAQVLNVENISRECAVKRRTVDNYFGIIEDTLLGRRLPAIQFGRVTKEVAHPKFYFFDAGVARAASGWIREDMPDAWRGFSLETIVLNELRARGSFMKKEKEIYHYGVNGGWDVDFIVETKPKIMHEPATYAAIEVKLSKTWKKEWSAPLIELARDKKARVNVCFGVYLGSDILEDGPLTIMGLTEFSRRLWAGELF